MPKVTTDKHNGGARIHTKVWVPPVSNCPKATRSKMCNYPCLTEETGSGSRFLPKVVL